MDSALEDDRNCFDELSDSQTPNDVVWDLCQKVAG
jgi:hypothetical protein